MESLSREGTGLGMSGDSFDAFLFRQQQRCREKARSALARVRRRQHALLSLAPDIVTVQGTYGGGPSPRMHHDDGLEWFVRKAVEHR